MANENSANSIAAHSLASKGMVPLQAITAVLLRATSQWIKIIPGSFDLCEINFVAASGSTTGGVVGFRFASEGMDGRDALLFTQMDSIAAIQLEQPIQEETE